VCGFSLCCLLSTKLPQSRTSSIVSARRYRRVVLVVDDNSPDGTARIAAEVGDRFGNVDVLPDAASSALAARIGRVRVGLERGYERSSRWTRTSRTILMSFPR